MGTMVWAGEDNSWVAVALRWACGRHRTLIPRGPTVVSSPLHGGDGNNQQPTEGEECTIASATTDAIVHQLLE